MTELTIACVFNKITGCPLCIYRYSYIKESDKDILSIFKQVEFTPGNYYLYENDSHIYNLYNSIDNYNVVYLLITTKLYPKRLSMQFLSELNSQYLISSNLKNLLAKMGINYKDITKIDTISSLNKQIDETKNVMMDNINLICENSIKLDSLVVKTEELSKHSEGFKRSATDLKRRMYCMNLKRNFIIGFIVLSLFFIVIFTSICSMGGCNSH